ncbi:MAG: DUF58 domain-containing protein [Clostridia bacterium]|nr:DUF58 domain-containing protein [Clostridia bacterium]
MILSILFYFALAIVAFVFSQALYDSISLFTLVVVLLIPVISLLCLLISLMLVKVEVGQVKPHQTRLQEFVLPIRIISKTPFMLPMMKLMFTVSSPEGDGSVPGYTYVHYRAFGKTTIEIPLKFNVRGVYKVGAKRVVFYDFLRIFSIRRKIGKIQTVVVEPRHLYTEMPLEVTSQEQENTVTAGGKETRYNGDMAGIREFNEYDTLRQVHWKLSARLSKMIVKTYWENTCDNVMIFADLFTYEEEALTNRHLTDCVVELTSRLTSALVDEGGQCVLSYPNYESMLHQQNIATMDDYLAAQDLFAMTPMMGAGSLEQALSEVDFSSLNGGAFYVVTSCPAERLERTLEPFVRGLNCRLHYLVIRPEAEPAKGNHTTVMTLAELEDDE